MQCGRKHIKNNWEQRFNFVLDTKIHHNQKNEINILSELKLQLKKSMYYRASHHKNTNTDKGTREGVLVVVEVVLLLNAFKLCTTSLC